MLPGFDQHPDLEAQLEPWVTKVARLNVMFVGLAMKLAMLTFHQVQMIYTLAGGPSFNVEQFNPDNSNEVERIAVFLQERSLELVNQTVLQTAFHAIGQTQFSDTLIDTKPADPPMAGGPDTDVHPELRQIAGEFADLAYEGHGACANIYTGIYRPTGAKVAVKHMKAKGDKERQHCAGEIQAHQAFAHPACLGYVTSKGVDGNMLLATPFMERGDLQRALRLEWNKTPYVEWATIKTTSVFGIAFGMEHIHSRGFVHRDLKPANILLDARFRPVIADFGLTRRTGSEMGEAILSPTLRIGTPLHMAPEVFAGNSESYTQAVDVYSYAVLLYSLFCEDPLKHLDDRLGPAKDESNLMRRIDKGVRFERVPGIPDSYWQLITAMWSHNPSTRGTFSDIVSELVKRPADFMIDGSNHAAVMNYIHDMVPLRPT
jgi:hypothetical protein